ncbi:MAG: HAMP domain-containing histidine kinase [Paraprevotella sp.]|nr:HAMP domain-containing histidine kinase [Paraprevotella sp.]
MEPVTNGFRKMKNKKPTRGISLLSKTLRLFAYCTAICFALTAPLFYLLTKYFYAEDMVDIIEAVEQGQGIPPLDLEQDIIAGMMLQFLLIFLVITMALFLTVRFATKKLWQPFDDTLRKAEQFNLARSGIPLFMETDIYEFARLNHSLGQLMKKDKDIYRIQREFTENASHELQTPLAIIRSKLDLLMLENLTESQMQLVSDLYELTMRMGHLNRNLLLLAKIENAQYTVWEEVDIAALLADSLPLYETLQNGKTLRMYDRRISRDSKLRANPVLLECLLKNLIVNALRYSKDKGEVQIWVENNSLTVSNESTDGKSLDADTLFCRFRPGNAGPKGNGLGLAIVKAICDFHHWIVEYKFEAGCHHFIVNFHTKQL